VRGLIADLVSPHPVGPRLPALFQDDVVSQQLCASLDESLAPIIATLDGLSAYLDPSTTPEDMLEWLAAWVGLALEPGQSIDRQRELVIAGVDLLAWRGTPRGVREAVHVMLGVEPEIIETGASEWSVSTGTVMPGEPGARMTVRIGVADPASVDVGRVDDLVAATKPAHVRHSIDIRVID
jgi:phage tail-like protein